MEPHLSEDMDLADGQSTLPPSDDDFDADPSGRKVTTFSPDDDEGKEMEEAKDDVSEVSKPFDRRKLLLQAKSSKSRLGSFGHSLRNLFQSVRTTFWSARKKSVTFDTIEVREHEVTLGDNPSCSHGPPVSMKWQHKSVFRLSLDDYEGARDGTRRKQGELAMPRYVREKMLRESGVSRSEMIDVVSENLKIKESNRNSVRRHFAKQRFVGSVKKIIPGFIKRSKSNPV